MRKTLTVTLVLLLQLIHATSPYAFSGPSEFNVTVAGDGTGTYKTIKEAVDNAPIGSHVQYIIYIKEGIYRENIEIQRTKMNLVFIGDGAGRSVITGNHSHGTGFGTHESATVAAKGNGFVAKFLTIENSAKPNEGMAVAFLNEANHSAIYQCVFLSYQDTLYARSGWQFYRECDIHGTVDIIFGFATAVFQNCNLYARLPNRIITFTAQGKDESHLDSGYSIQNCSITVSPELELERNVVKGFLGRPWRDYSTVVVMESWLDNIIDPRGWSKLQDKAVDNLTYQEYKNRGPGANTGGRVRWPSYKIMQDIAEAMQYTVTEFLKGETWLPQTGVPYYGGLATA